MFTTNIFFLKFFVFDVKTKSNKTGEKSNKKNHIWQVYYPFVPVSLDINTVQIKTYIKAPTKK